MELYFDDISKQRSRQISVPKTGVGQIKSNGKSYPYLYPIGDLLKEASVDIFIKASMCAPTKEVS
jgi:hypothetical protein